MSSPTRSVYGTPQERRNDENQPSPIREASRQNLSPSRPQEGQAMTFAQPGQSSMHDFASRRAELPEENAILPITKMSALSLNPPTPPQQQASPSRQITHPDLWASHQLIPPPVLFPQPPSSSASSGSGHSISPQAQPQPAPPVNQPQQAYPSPPTSLPSNPEEMTALTGVVLPALQAALHRRTYNLNRLHQSQAQSAAQFSHHSPTETQELQNAIQAHDKHPETRHQSRQDV